MSDIALKIEGISKCYQLGLTGYTDLRAALTGRIAHWLGRRKRSGKVAPFWALKDISMDIRRGETVGIIGLNGAGKSTLLKLCSRITYPTEGRIEINGRVASLLEVGTGFHPELTGRENVFLNGAILGMSRTEIKRKFDEIVDFSGVADFLDTPIKRYSSGMTVRLAFSVAAHLEAEILLIDEVLSVGDLAFQKKCLGKMDEVAASGRTVVMVSHNMRSIKQLCRRGILLHHGALQLDDQMDRVIQAYAQQHIEDGTALVDFTTMGSTAGLIQKVGLYNQRQQLTNQFYFGESFTVAIQISPSRPMHLIPIIGIETVDGVRVATAKGMDREFSLESKTGETTVITAQFAQLTLTPGRYQLLIRLVEAKGHVVDQKKHAIGFDVLESNEEGVPPFSGGLGLIRTLPNWSTQNNRKL
ncbi:MAG: ABC transporter ATP-binding protein [Bacteroidota bacterium]